MQYMERTLQAHPSGQRISGQLPEAIEAIADNAMTCHVCADACLHEAMPKDLVQCIERNLECAASCEATVTMLLHAGSTNQQVWQAQLDACAKSCAECAQECDKHAQMHEHCRICAESCRSAQQACQQASQAVRQTSQHAMA